MNLLGIEARSSWAILFCVLGLTFADRKPLSAIPLAEREALGVFYTSTGGDNWINRTGWLGAEGTECPSPASPGWFGVRCNANQSHVIGLELNSNGLSGTLPEAIGALEELVTLNVGNNKLSGPIPLQIGNTHLEVLLLENNRLTGPMPAAIQNLARLTKLDLRFNRISGNIPSGITLLSQLQEFLLEGNLVTGTIPSAIGNLSALRRLNLTANQLEGEIPSTIGRLMNLIELTLDQNRLSGTIPRDIGALVQLERLVLGANQLQGSIPSELGGLGSLKLLSIGQCQLTGPIPAELGNLADLEELSLGTNQLSGQIPPSLGRLAKLANLYLDTNQLDGMIPEEISSLPSLVRLHLYRNHFLGNIPEGFESPQLASLNLSANRLSGPIPESLGQLASLVELDFSANSLSGEIPNELLGLTQLSVVGLRWNAVFTANRRLTEFLNARSRDGAFELTQTVAPVGTTLTASPAGAASILLEWRPIVYTNNEGGYQISMALNPSGPFTVIGEAPAKVVSSFLVTDLQPGAIYHFRLESFTLAHAANQNVVLSQPSRAVSTATALPAAPGELRFSLSSYQVAEGERKLIQVERLRGSSGITTVRFTTESGSARSSDFVSTSTVLRWSDGDVEPKTVAIQILSDTLDEVDESLTLRLAGPTGGTVLGSPATATLHIIDEDVSGSGFDPTIAIDPAGTQLLVWVGPGDGPSLGIFGRFAASDGVAQGDSFLINNPTSSVDEKNPAVTAIGQDEFVVSWEGTNAMVLRCVRRRRGRPNLGSQHVVASSTAGISDSALAADPLAAHVTLVWRVGRQLRGRLFNPVTDTAGKVFRIDGSEPGLLSEPALAYSTDGATRLIVWRQSRPRGDSDIFARAFDRAGIPRGDEFMLNASPIGKQTSPTIAGLVRGRFLVGWQTEVQDRSAQEQLGADILARQINGGGEDLGPEFQVNLSLRGSQVEPRLVRSLEGSCSFVWVSEGAGLGDGISVRSFPQCDLGGTSEFRIQIERDRATRAPQLVQAGDRATIVFERDDAIEADGGILVRALTLD